MGQSFTRVSKEHAKHLSDVALERVYDRRSLDWDIDVEKFRKKLAKRWFNKWRKVWTDDEIRRCIILDGFSPQQNYFHCKKAAHSIDRLIKFTDTDDIFISANDMADLCS